MPICYPFKIQKLAMLRMRQAICRRVLSYLNVPCHKKCQSNLFQSPDLMCICDTMYDISHHTEVAGLCSVLLSPLHFKWDIICARCVALKFMMQLVHNCYFTHYLSTHIISTPLFKALLTLTTSKATEANNRGMV